MIKDIPPLDAEVRALLDIERMRPDPPAEVRAKVHARVLAVAVGLGTAAPGTAQAAGGAGSASATAHLLSHPIRLLMAATVVSSAIVVGVTMTRPTRMERAARAAPTAATPIPASHSIEPPALAPAEPAATVADRVPARPPRPGPRSRAEAPAPTHAVVPDPPATADPQLTVERTLLERARGALAAGQFRQAVGIAAMHQRRFPEGRLVEQRERLWIQALISSGEAAEARRRLADLERSFPDSIFLPDLRAALRPVP